MLGLTGYLDYFYLILDKLFHSHRNFRSGVLWIKECFLSHKNCALSLQYWNLETLLMWLIFINSIDSLTYCKFFWIYCIHKNLTNCQSHSNRWTTWRLVMSFDVPCNLLLLNIWNVQSLFPSWCNPYRFLKALDRVDHWALIRVLQETGFSE